MDLDSKAHSDPPGLDAPRLLDDCPAVDRRARIYGTSPRLQGESEGPPRSRCPYHQYINTRNVGYRKPLALPIGQGEGRSEPTGSVRRSPWRGVWRARRRSGWSPGRSFGPVSPPTPGRSAWAAGVAGALPSSAIRGRLDLARWPTYLGGPQTTVVEIPDIYHVREHLWRVAEVSFGERSAAARVWVEPP